ncbi:hypothetical protein ABZW96_35920 [Nocardia sp. NPDC004168]|uniref:hypothetical protein n=1 Tax=Nocardia sp. NPDC004168 TaxID=3154452 RepID=UPI0033BD593F
MSDPTTLDMLLELARRARVPEALTEGGRTRRFGATHDVVVQRGQLWRASWDETSLLVLVLRVEQTTVAAAPVTVDPPAEDEHCAVVGITATALEVEATVWMGLRSELPMRVLDTVVDQWADRIVDDLNSDSVELSADDQSLVRRGLPITSEYDTAAAIRAEIADDLDALRSSPALPASTGEDKGRPLAAVLGESLDLAALAAVLKPFGLNQGETMQIVRGKKGLTPDQARAVADSTGIAVEAVLNAVQPLPQALVAEAEHPRWRESWRAWAEQEGVDEATARIRVSYGAYALAARQTGSNAPDWAGRLEQVLLRRHRGDR